jgi:acid stress chaperone HdeB
MTMKRAWPGMIVAAAVSGSIAHAQTTIDVAKITCEQLVLMKVVDPDYLAVWLSGYYSGKRDTTTIDVQRLKDNAQKVKQYCLYNNKGTVMEAIEKVLLPPR